MSHSFAGNYRRSGKSLVAAIVAAIVTVACQDSTTAPSVTHEPYGKAGRYVGDDSTYGSYSSATEGVYHRDVDPWDGSAAPLDTWDFHFPTIITLTASGGVTQIPGALHGDDVHVGPEGTVDHQSAMAFMNGGAYWYASGGEPMTVKVQGVVLPMRTPFNEPQPMGEPWWTCGRQFNDRDHPCWSFGGEAHLAFQRVSVNLTLGSSHSGRVEPLTAVTFTASMDSLTVNGETVDMSLLKWIWESADSTSADTIVCNSVSGSQCTKTITAPGTMSVTAYVNGQQQRVDRFVDVHYPRLTLNASKTLVMDPGDTVTFTADGNGDTLVVTGWYFDLDTTSTSSFSRQPGSSTQTVTTSIPSLSRVPKVQRSLSGSGTWDNCEPGEIDCDNFVSETGTVTVTATVNGVPLQATIQVAKVRCPTGDPLLDSDNVRKAMLKAMMLSAPNDSLGTGLGPNNDHGTKREHGLAIYRRLNGSYAVVELSAMMSTQCTIEIERQPTFHDWGMLVALFHTHPTEETKPMYCLMHSPDGTVCKRYPADPTPNAITCLADFDELAFNDPNDWGGSDFFGVRQYIMTASGRIVVLPPTKDLPESQRESTRNDRTHFWKSPTGCNWVTPPIT